jgi:GNAT superfamily N-acetyltransferase
MALEFRPADPAAPPAGELIEAMVAEVSALYGRRIDGADAPAADPADLTPARGGACVVGWAGDAPVAVGVVRRLAPGVGEIKRMYVVPEARGRGVGRALLAALEDAARALGYERVRLDTGVSQQHARALYASAGFGEIADYNGNPHASYWGEKRLSR